VSIAGTVFYVAAFAQAQDDLAGRQMVQTGAGNRIRIDLLVTSRHL
jgi:hypothetical protein